MCWVSKDDCMLVPNYKVTNPLVYGAPEYAPFPDRVTALYSQAAIDTLRAQLEAAEAENLTRAEDYARLTDLWQSDEARYVARAEAAEAECSRLREDAERLNFLDQMNASLNAHYGTNYGWRLVLSHQITRLMSGEHRGGFVGDIDLNDQDGTRDRAASCRDAIDAARTKEETK